MTIQIQAEQEMQFIEFNKDVNTIIKFCFTMISKKMERYLKDWEDTRTFNAFLNKIERINNVLHTVVNNKMNDTMYQSFYSAVERYLNDWEDTSTFNSKITAIEQVLKNSSSDNFLDKKAIFVCISQKEILDNVVFFKDDKALFNSLLSNWEERRLKGWDDESTYNSHVSKLNKCRDYLEQLDKKQWGLIVHSKLLTQLGLVYEDNVDGKKVVMKMNLKPQDKKEAQKIIKNSKKNKSDTIETVHNEVNNNSTIQTKHKMGFFKKLIIALQFLFGKNVDSLLKEEKTTVNKDLNENETISTKEKMLQSLENLLVQKSLNEINQQLIVDIVSIIRNMPINEKQNVAEFVEIKNTCLSILPNLVSIFNETQNKDLANENGKNAHQFLEESLVSVKQYLEESSKSFQASELNSIEVYSSFVQNKFKKASM
jgi:uncharacterized protein YlaN (UPF0358 family)